MKGCMSLFALLALVQACQVAAQGGVFQHGVASGDPTQDSVILWTRITLPGVGADGVASNSTSGVNSDGVDVNGVGENGHDVTVTWELADNEGFANAVSGEFATRVDRDYTVNVDVQNLEAGMQYYYRFSALGETSPVGHTKTFPGPGDMRSVKIALASCSNWDYGYFHAYDHMTKVEGLDLVIHVGDYIYEYQSVDNYGSWLGAPAELVQEFGDNRPDNVPDRETVTLSDYRARHAQYRTSPRLQELHRLVPMIAAWDDHEITNNAWKSGAENHDPSEGDIGVRMRAAVRAYLEWMPIRRPPGIGRDIYREFQIGDLATLVMLETRLTARTKQIELQETPWALTALVSPEDLPNGVPLPDQPGTLLPVEQAAALTLATYSNPNSSMIGKTQLNNLTEALAASGAAGTRWQIVAGQTVLAPMSFPNFVKGAAAVGGPAHEAVARQFVADIMDPQLYISQGMDSATAAQTAGVARVFVSSSDYGLPFNSDSWDGYTYERSKVLEAMQQEGVNAVYLAGDTHNAWAFNIQSEQNESVVAAVEFDCTSITSRGLENALTPQLNGLEQYFLGAGLEAVDMGDLLAAGGLGANSNMMYSEPFHRGYTLLEVGPESLKASYWFVDSVFTETYEPYCDAAFIVTDVREGMTPTEC